MFACVSAGSIADLPACPCVYPNSIFYDNQIWDKKRERKFRWRDVSHDKDRLAIYKPGAVYCVQTLPSQENESAIVQHCCYDENRRLLTRGSGAGTPYIVSPDISPLLHDKIDLLPWRLCKGDFTRCTVLRDISYLIDSNLVNLREQKIIGYQVFWVTEIRKTIRLL